MVISAWERTKARKTARVVSYVCNALDAADILNTKDIDVTHMALRIAENVTDPGHKATLLSRVACVLSEAHRPEEGIEVLLAALEASSMAGRETLMEVLADGAMTLASVDNGELLWNLCQELENVDNWFDSN